MLFDVVQLTQDMVRLPSLSGQEQAMAALVQSTMERLGYSDISIDANGSVLGFLGPRNAEVAVLFDAHMDVVPIVGIWTVDPFGAHIADGRMYGRGTTDMKAGLAAALCGAAQAAHAGVLKKRIAVSASVMEEVIEGYALALALDQCQPQAVVICEPSKLEIKIGQKGRQEILLTLRGTPAHAALPHLGINPIHIAAKAILALECLDLPADKHVGRAILVPTDIISDPHPSISLIPSSVTVRLDRRTLVGESSEVVLQQIRDCLQQAEISDFTIRLADSEVGAYTGITGAPLRDLPAWYLDRNDGLTQAMVQAVTDAGLAPTISTWWFCTNGSESAGRRGIPTIGLGPGDEAHAHTADESVAITDVIGARDIYQHLCLLLAG